MKSIKTIDILPTQNYLKESTIKFILTCFVNNNFNELPPPPIVKESDSIGKFTALDGHNLIAIFDMMGLDVKVHIANSNNDGLKNKTENESIKKRNLELGAKFKHATTDLLRTQQQGIFTFSDLRQQYPFLENINLARIHFKL